MIRSMSAVAAAVAAAVAVLVAAPATTASPQAMTLRGSVGPGFTITLKLNGKKVSTLKAGRYKLVVSDKASIHNFVLERSGGGFERAVTSVPFVGTKTITVTLRKGKYEYYCAPHESIMHGDLRVT